MTAHSRYMLLGEPEAGHLTASELQSKFLSTCTEPPAGDGLTSVKMLMSREFGRC